ncbi:hypothetical protein [Actinomadura rubrobrunea]|uniref:hypothetical protein n=1 Tax=Actinomadura rubrobrunea TaxID=115335 RepID=UPI00082C8235|nr:hypothetical protein [Actinomadura rubrobrunea]
MITTSNVAEQSIRTVLRPGVAPAYRGRSAHAASGSVLGGEASLISGDAWSLRLRVSADPCDVRQAQRVQIEQGRGVFALLAEGNDVMAPATAHVGASFTELKGGVSGPYPWRRPV